MKWHRPDYDHGKWEGGIHSNQGRGEGIRADSYLHLSIIVFQFLVDLSWNDDHIIIRYRLQANKCLPVSPGMAAGKHIDNPYPNPKPIIPLVLTLVLDYDSFWAAR